MSQSNHSAEMLVRKLQSEFHLTSSERDALFALPLQFRMLGKGQDIVREGDRPSQCCVVLDGWACRYKMLDDGSRQILCFQIAGDFTDLQSLHLDVMDHNIGTLGGCTVAFVPHTVLRALVADYPRIGAAFWRDTLVDASITREWLLNVGAREAYNRLAHLICEVYTRLQVVGRTDGFRFNFPISQATLADATGVSGVHVNRMLQALREDGLITLRNGVCDVRNWEALVHAGQFDAKYLHVYRNGHGNHAPS
jgi:CRP-like cAMP-binding protein